MFKKFVVILLAVGATAAPAQALNMNHLVHAKSNVYHCPCLASWGTGHYLIVWRKSNSHYYAEWECTVAGTIVGAGITFLGWPETSWTFMGILGGGSFTGGCELGAPQKPLYYMSGVPWSHYCWMVYPHGSYKRRYMTCVA